MLWEIGEIKPSQCYACRYHAVSRIGCFKGRFHGSFRRNIRNLPMESFMLKFHLGFIDIECRHDGSSCEESLNNRSPNVTSTSRYKDMCTFQSKAEIHLEN